MLGFVVKSSIEGYEALCAEHELVATVQWQGGAVAGLRRYSWEHFVDLIDAVTIHLRKNGLEPIHFQRRILPILFRRLYSTRFLRKAIDPKNIIKMIDVCAGPFMFRCGHSKFEDLADGRVCIRIDLHPGMRGSIAFFEHCVAGMVAQLEFLGFLASVVESMTLTERSVEVIFDLEEAAGRREERHATEPESLENFLHWLGEFEDSIIRSPSEPSDKILKEGVEHLCAAAAMLGQHKGMVRDLVTVIGCRLQFAQARGWTGEDGCAQRRLAAERCADIRARFSDL